MDNVKKRKRNKRRFVFTFLIFNFQFLIILSSCTLPSEGWYSRIEKEVADTRQASQETAVNTNALAETIKDESIQEKRIASLADIPSPGNIPSDNTSNDFIETLLYILLGLSGLGVLGKTKPFLRQAIANQPDRRKNV